MHSFYSAEQVAGWVRATQQFDEHFIVGIDGCDGIGKSPLARYLALELRSPALELDLYLLNGSYFPHFRKQDLDRVLERAEATRMPLIVEGVFLLHALTSVGRVPRSLVYVKKVASGRRWHGERLFSAPDSEPLSRRFPESMWARCISTRLADVQESEPLLYRLALYHQECEPHLKAHAFVEWEAFSAAS
jgi:hypothetical protein